MNNLETLISLNNLQGGTIHQFAKFYGVSTAAILNFSNDELQEIIANLAVNIDSKILTLAYEYYNKKEVTLVEVTNMVIKYHFNKEL